MAPKNPKGAKSDKVWREALMLAVNEEAEAAPGKGGSKLRKLATKVVDEAIDGNMVAAKEIGDRLDGKAAQSMDLKVTSDPVEELRNHVASGKRPEPG